MDPIRKIRIVYDQDGLKCSVTAADGTPIVCEWGIHIELNGFGQSFATIKLPVESLEYSGDFVKPFEGLTGHSNGSVTAAGIKCGESSCICTGR